MILRIKRTRQAKSDALYYATYIAKATNWEKGEEFLTALEGEYTRLAAMSGLGSPRSYGSLQVRVWPISRFKKYLIFYKHTDSTLEIIRIQHGTRDLARILSQPQE